MKILLKIPESLTLPSSYRRRYGLFFFVLSQQSVKSGYFMFINTRSEDFFWYCGYASDLSSGSKVSSLQQQHFEYLKKKSFGNYLKIEDISKIN